MKIQHGPATVSVEDRSNRPLFHQGMGRLTGPLMRESGDRPARLSMGRLPRDHMLNQLQGVKSGSGGLLEHDTSIYIVGILPRLRTASGNVSRQNY